MVEHGRLQTNRQPSNALGRYADVQAKQDKHDSDLCGFMDHVT